MSSLGLGPSVYVRKETNSSNQLKIPFTRAYGFQSLQGDDDLTYQPSTGTLSAQVFNGTVSGNVSHIDVEDDDTETTVYPTFVSNNGTNQQLMVDKLSLKYSPVNHQMTIAGTTHGVMNLETSTGGLKGVHVGNNVGTFYTSFLDSLGNANGVLNITRQVTGNQADVASFHVNQFLVRNAANNFTVFDVNDLTVSNDESTMFLNQGTLQLEMKIKQGVTDDFASIQCKSSLAQYPLYLNPEGGQVYIGGSNTSGVVCNIIGNDTPSILFNYTAGAVDQKLMNLGNFDGGFFISFQTDAGVSQNVMGINRQVGSNLADSVAFNANNLIVTSALTQTEILKVSDNTAGVGTHVESILKNGNDIHLIMQSIYDPGVDETAVIKCQNSSLVPQTLKINPDGGKVTLGDVTKDISVDAGVVLIGTSSGVPLTGLKLQCDGVSRFDETIHAGSLYDPNTVASGIQMTENAGQAMASFVRLTHHTKVMGYINNTSTFGIVDWNMTGNGMTLAANAQAWGSQSDGTTKIIRSHIENVLDTIDSIQCVRFNYKTDADIDPQGYVNYTKERIGFIAQDILPLYPEAVEVEPDQPLRLQYQDMIPVTVQGIKELCAELRRLSDRVTALEAQLG